jgi:hypothetical protein
VQPVDKEYNDCAIYLYPSREAADAGDCIGGTGFLVSVPSERHKKVSHVYAVTNRHVIEGDERRKIAAAPVPRLNTAVGAHKVLPFTVDDWTIHPGKDDIAAVYIDSERLRVFDFRTVTVERFVTRDHLGDEHAGVEPGALCFMVGRFMSHEGRQRNTPAVRFGNISMMPWEPLETRYKNDQEGFLVEMHSMGGYSGSPVFLYIFPFHSHMTRLLGIDWGHLPSRLDVMRDDEKKGPVQLGNAYVNANSGLCTVIPAWRIRELLDHPDLVAPREADDMRRTRAETQPQVIEDSSGGPPPRGPEPERLKIDDTFDNAARKLAQTPPPEGGWPKPASRKRKPKG